MISTFWQHFIYWILFGGIALWIVIPKILLLTRREKGLETITVQVPVSVIMKEVDFFIMENLTRMVWERLILGKNDTGKAFKDITDPQEPYYRGMIAKICSSMGPALKASFYTVYKQTKDDHNLITYVNQVMELYSILLVNRTALLQKQAHAENRKAELADGYDGLPPIDKVNEYVNAALIEAVATDIKSFSNMLDTVVQTQQPQSKE